MMDGKDKEQPGGLGSYRLVRTISGKGAGRGQFSEVLRAVAVDDAGSIYAVGDSHVKVFDGAGNFKHSWATEGRDSAGPRDGHRVSGRVRDRR